MKPMAARPLISPLLDHRREKGFRLHSLAILLGALLGGKTLAQDVIRETEHLASDRPEAWAMNYFTSVTLLAGLGVPRSRAVGSIELGLELDSIPQLSTAERRVGFNGTKEEDLNQAPIFGRPRVTLGLPGRFASLLSYLPPVEIFGLKPNLFAFALERPLYESDPWTLGMRMYGQIGDVEGAFTCPKEVARLPPGSPKNPNGCERESADKVTQHYAGLEFSGAYRIQHLGGVSPYFAVAGNFLDMRLHVDNITFGVRDQRQLAAETWTFSLSAGVAYPLTKRCTLSIGLFYSPLWVTRPPATSSENDGLLNARALLTYQWFE
jgi:hypothetical protein